jgi:predicted nucleotidyltransferase
MEVRQPDEGRQRLTGPLGERVRMNRPRLLASAASFGVHNLRVFGGVAPGEDSVDSDLDLLVDCPYTSRTELDDLD